jgi:hypothetical protein
MRELNVSRGQSLKFAFNGEPATGIIVGAETTPGPWASIALETDAAVPEGAQLSMPDLPETGGCGLAHPVIRDSRSLVILSIGYSYVDVRTIGR